jgi:glycosyltransferase involved in cell wall biosynthesis
VTALRGAITALVRDPERRARMGARGRGRAEALFSARAHAESIAAIYERVSAPYLRCGGEEA